MEINTLSRENLLQNTNLDLRNLETIFKDLLQGDRGLIERGEVSVLNIEQIRLAIDFLLKNPKLTDQERTQLFSNLWMINYRDRPPTPEEFITEKYLGPTASTIWPHVKKAFIEFMDPSKPYRTAVLYPYIGWGKMVYYNCKIYTPDGYKTPKDIKENDLVCTPSGGFAKIIKKQDYPEEIIYKITFSDGREAFTGGPHFWKAAKSYNTKIWDKENKKYIKTQYSIPNWKIITTEEIIKSLDKNKKERWFIPLTKPVDHCEKPHLIDPYSLGVFLTLLKPSAENAGVEELKRLGLLNINIDNSYSYEKFIPEEYLYNSIENRVKLLQGLMDNGGTILKKSGLIFFYTTSERLKEGMIELVRGLGGEAFKKGNCSILISFPENNFPIFSLKRKQDIVDYHYNRPRTKRKGQYLYIKSIEKTPLKGGACIEIDDEERLFLTDGYIVTHNSFLTVLINIYIGLHLSMMLAPWKFFNLSQPLDCKVLTPKGFINMGDIQIGDAVITPLGKEEKVVQIHPQGIIPTYEIELDNGKKTRCSETHLWKVFYRKDSNNNKIWETVNTKFMIDHPELEFEIPEFENPTSLQIRMGILKKITRVEDQEQQCISISGKEQLYVTDDNIVTHNSPSTVLTQVFGAASLKKSSEILFEPMLLILESSNFFEKVHTREGMISKDKDFSRTYNIDKIYWTTAVPTSAIQFSNGANYKLISNPNGLLGQTIVCGNLTELAFFLEAGKSEAEVFRFFTKLRGRIESRMKGNYFGRFVLDSSPNSLENVIDEWIADVAPKNKENYIISGARWKYVKDDFPENTFDEHGNVRHEKAFPVFKGGKGRPPKILNKESVVGYEDIDLVWVPDTSLMRGHFEENVIEALKDIAGIPAGTNDRIFYDNDIIERIFTDKLRNVYTHITADSASPPERLIWDQIKDIFFIKVLDRYQFWRNPKDPRVFSVDQSLSGDVTAISVSHPERIERINYVTGEKEFKTITINDMIIVITPKGGRINLDAIKLFITDLRDLGGLNIVKGSFDSFESASTLQYLKRMGFEIEKLSVDFPLDPYLNFISIIENDLFKSGRNIHLKNNLKSLQIVKRKRTDSLKVDHMKGDLVYEDSGDWEISKIGIFAKDAADAVCGNVELIRKHMIVPYSIYDEENIIAYSRENTLKNTKELLTSMGFKI